MNAQFFPTIPPSPTSSSAPDMVAVANGWCASPMVSPAAQCTSSRINFAGSWLDLGSDSEDEYTTSHRAHSGGLSLRNRRKGSSLSSKDSGKNALTNLKELTRRSSMHFRKLTNRSGASN
ncbi:hypothetical protein IW138_003983 [Coemansia sp. RSA 986]|nr:hypothetical protein IW138_003983 [Coemansia sp. RSA 986]